MSIKQLITHSAGEYLAPLFAKSIKTSTQVANISYGLFSATPPTPIPSGMEAGVLYDPVDASYQPTTINFYWFHLGGILGQMTAEIRSADNLTTYASAVLNVNAPVYPTALTILLPLPSVKTPLKVVLATDATCNSSVNPYAIEFV